MAIREEKPIIEIAQETGAHPNMISKWKRELLYEADSAFRNGKFVQEQDLEKVWDALFKQI
ncbi:hypothetical protein [Spirochaeta cellobiosiphila]|uniref:hypothetical protein n=1 Tax=Spirochaeta cellobiosiphila TaxID=504483 RepID=UPI000415C34C|nr:hypothetical protein [Spirochaeta cellobiosiphila]